MALPEGLAAFRAYLRSANPDCVHFHGIYAGIGITPQHIVEAKALGFHIVYTMHLPMHVCATQTLVYKDQKLCDGIIRQTRCASCNLKHQKNNKYVAGMAAGVSTILQKAGVDSGHWNNSLGTALSSVNRIVDIKKDLEKLAIHCDKVVLYAKWFRKMIIANGFPEEKTTYVPPALSYGGMSDHPIEPLRFSRKESIKILFIGRIHPAKGVLLLLQALKDFPEEKIELSIYGKSGDALYYEECRKLSENKKNVHWRGILSREELLATFARHDILCLPSAFSEMSPLVIQEAFGAGIPVLASEGYGNEELIRHNDNGVLFPFKSLGGLRRQLTRLLEEEGLLPSLKAGVAIPISFDEVAARYVEIYKSLK